MAQSILHKTSWLVVWSLLCAVTLQQQNPPGGYAFINPPPKNDTTDPYKVFDLKSDINIRWSGPTQNNISLRFVQNVPNKDIYNYVIWGVTNLKGQLLWHVNLTDEMNLTVSDKFYFDIFVEGYTTPSAWSQDFFITTAGSAPSTTATSSTTISTTSSSPTTTGFTTSVSTNPASSSATTTNTAVPADTGLSSGAKAGIGVGVAVGVIALLTAAAFFWRSRRRRHDDLTGGMETSQPSGTTYHSVNQGMNEEDYKASMVNRPLSEAPANEVRPELPGSNHHQAFEMADTSSPHR